MASLLDAIWDKDLKAVREFLEDDPRLANGPQEGQPPLHWACSPPNPEIVRALLDFGADTNLAGEDGETPLQIAASESSEECVQQLLDHGADVNAKANDGMTPLMYAAKAGPAVVRLLLERGADATRRDEANRTALHWAITGDHDDPEVARLLLAAGADPKVKNLNGDTALDYARALKKTALESVLRGL
jgi:ankyrin repeat protein